MIKVLKDKILIPHFFVLSGMIITGSISAAELYKLNRLVYLVIFLFYSGITSGLIIRLRQVEKGLSKDLSYERHKLRNIIKGIADPVVLLDSNFRVKVMNDSWEALYNIKESYVLNKHFMDVVKDENLFGYISYIQGSGQILGPKIVCINTKGKDSYYNVVIKSMLNDIVIILQNVTHMKELEKIKSNLIDVISNEFRTPLTSMMIGVSMLAGENIGFLNDRQKKVMETIQEDTQSLSCLIENLIQMLKIELDKPIFNIQPCNINDIIKNCEERFKEKTKVRGIVVTYNANNELPDINVDYEQIIRVVDTLLSNSLKFTKPGDEITLSAFAKSKNLCICIKDTGVGISEEYRDKIFQKFTDIKDNNLESYNTGLEMAVAKEIVEAHGGEIWYESKPGIENFLMFTLPICSSS